MKYLWLALNWVCGLIFLLFGVVSLFDDPRSAIVLVAIALLLLPPVRNAVYSKTQRTLPFKVRAMSIFVLMIVFGVFAGQSQHRKTLEFEAKRAQEQAQKAAKIREGNIKYFNDNRSMVLSDVRNAIEAKKHQEAISLSAKYLPAKDPELSKLHQSAKVALSEFRKAEKAKKILAELKTIPATEYAKNKKLYQQLVTLYPTNETYKSKTLHYEAKLADKKEMERLAAELKRRIERRAKEKEQLAAKRQKRIESQFSVWDGCHYNLERLIKKAMNDPDSYDHVETRYWDRTDHLVVKTTYRGKNAFGGVVTNWVKAKVDLDGNVTQIIETYPQ